MKHSARVMLLVLTTILPMPLKRLVYSLLGWDVDPSVRVGCSIIIANYVSLGQTTRIGHFNIIKNIDRFVVGRNCYIRHFNNFFAQADTPDMPRVLTIGDETQVMSRHFIDVGGVIEIGDRVVIAGRDSQIWSHSVREVDDKRRVVPGRVTVESDSYIGARSTLVECRIVEESVVAAGSVVAGSAGKRTGRRLLYRGNPATTSPLR